MSGSMILMMMLMLCSRRGDACGGARFSSLFALTVFLFFFALFLFDRRFGHELFECHVVAFFFGITLGLRFECGCLV